MRFTVRPSVWLSGSRWKSGRCCSSRSLPPSWELQEELMLSAGDLPSSALVEEWWWGGRPWTGILYPDWLRWSRGGETGSALMFMLWLVLMEWLELADLQTQKGERRAYICACWVRAPSTDETDRYCMLPEKTISLWLVSTEMCVVVECKQWHNVTKYINSTTIQFWSTFTLAKHFIL